MSANRPTRYLAAALLVLTLAASGANAATWPIRIKTNTGKTYDLQISPSDSIEEIKIRLHKLEGAPVEKQRLIFRGKQLEDGRSLGDYEVSENAVLHMNYSTDGN